MTANFNLDYTKTADLIAVYEKLKKPTTFLQDRYFEDGNCFETNEVLVEYKDGSKRLAPFVSPAINGKVVKRDKYTASAYQPAMIAPKRPMTIDTLNKKGFGEAFYKQLSKAERAMAIAAQDMTDMDEMITNRKEAMCAEVMQKNALVMKHYTDDNKLDEVKEIAFYEGDTNPAVYVPSKSWDDTTAKILDDVYNIGEIMSQDGVPAVDVIMGSNVAKAFKHNEEIIKELDNRRFEIGEYKPRQLGQDAFLMATLNVDGCDFNFLHYRGWYQDDETGKIKKYIDPDSIVVTAPKAGAINYGAITQIDYGEADFKTYAQKVVPLYEVKDQTRSIILRSAPLVQPKNKNCFYVSKAIFH